jgi:uncharacterized protein (DUF736 family)
MPESFAADVTGWECFRQSHSAIELCGTSLETDCQSALAAQPQHEEITMIIGNFAYDVDRDIYLGDITTLTLQRSNVELRPTDKAGDKAPDYRIVQERDGSIVEFGAAWKRSSGNGRDFLSIMLDDPALPAGLNAALFPSDRDDRATLVWQRQTKKTPAAEPEPTSSRPRRPAAARSPRLG